MKFLVAIANGLNTLRDFPPLLFRLLLAYIFFRSGMRHLQDIDGFTSLLGSLGVPAPYFMAWMVTCFQLASLVLIVGFATRIEALALVCTMAVAISLVHWPYGFEAADNGYEKPLYYLLMAFSLFITGPGKFSIDALLKGSPPKKKPKEPKRAD